MASTPIPVARPAPTPSATTVQPITPSAPHVLLIFPMASMRPLTLAQLVLTSIVWFARKTTPDVPIVLMATGLALRAALLAYQCIRNVYSVVRMPASAQPA